MSKVTPIDEAPVLTKAEKLDLYCQGLCDGKSRKQAYIAAGYADGPYALRNANHFHKSNLAYVNIYISEHIGGHAPVALKVVLGIMNDPEEKGGIRLKAAQDILDRAGFSAKQKVEVSVKDTKEMTTEELQDEIKRAFAEHSELAKILTFPSNESTGVSEA